MKSILALIAALLIVGYLGFKLGREITEAQTQENIKNTFYRVNCDTTRYVDFYVDQKRLLEDLDTNVGFQCLHTSVLIVRERDPKTIQQLRQMNEKLEKYYSNK